MDEDDEKISRQVDHPTRYKPQAKIVRLDESGFIARSLVPHDVKRIVELVANHAKVLGIDSYQARAKSRCLFSNSTCLKSLLSFLLARL